MMVLGFHNGAELAMFVTSLLTGVTMVMGVNAVNSAPSFMLDYYKYISKDPNATPQYPTFWTNVLNFYTVVTLVAQTIHEPTNLTSFMCRFSLLFRLELSSLLMLVELLVVVLLPHTGASELGAMVSIIIVAYLGGAARAYFENTGYAMFGPCPSKMLSGMLVGSALSGAVVSVIQIILMAAMPSTHEAVLTQSIIYFSLSLGIIFLAALLLIGLLFNPFAKQYIAEFRSRRSPLANIYRHLQEDDKKRSVEKDCDGADETGGMLTAPDNAPDTATHGASKGHIHLLATNGGASGNAVEQDDDNDVLFDDRVRTREEETNSRDAPNGDFEPAGHEEAEGKAVIDDDAVRLRQKLADFTEDGAASANPSDADELARAEVQQALTTSELLQGVQLWPVIKQIYPMMGSCLLTFLVTYLVYPGIMLAVDADDAWYTTVIMTVYNFGDLVGRAISMWKLIWPSRRVIIIGSIMRVVFIPLLFLCALGKIPTHAPAYVFTALMAVSNGFFGTLSMVYAPDTPTLKTDGERAIAGQAVGVCLLLGCSVGSLLQLAEVLPFS